MKYVGGGTNTGSAIAHARNVMFKSSYGGRDNAVKILIVITDGFSRNTTQAALEASICRSIGIKLFSIGVGFGVDTFELTAIANRPNEDDEKFSFRVDDFQGLETIRSAIVANVCKGMVLFCISSYYIFEFDLLLYGPVNTFVERGQLTYPHCS